ncbi:MAG: phytoene/squalene synthase family protein [Flavobacteriales bacterium]|jgi:phytoene synthase|nr:phytoene/squalene synthase family protein [Flavobacteriales bacterium]
MSEKSLFDKVSFESSKIVTNNYSTSFSLAVKMLSSRIQDDIHAIYGFVRFADEIVDTFHDYDKETLINEFERDLNLAIERGISLNPILNSFQDVLKRHNIDYELVNAFMKSMKFDLNKSIYSTTKDYEEYIYGSADVVGLMCLKVFVEGDEAMYEKLKAPAMRLGSAFQKVNFLRDLKADSEELNRVYFPHLEGLGLSEDNKVEIITEIQSDFDAALVGIKMLPDSAKFGVYTAFKYYSKLLNKLVKSDVEDIKANRIRVSNPMKFALLTKSYFDYKMRMI